VRSCATKSVLVILFSALVLLGGALLVIGGRDLVSARGITNRLVAGALVITGAVDIAAGGSALSRRGARALLLILAGTSTCALGAALLVDQIQLTGLTWRITLWALVFAFGTVMVALAWQGASADVRSFGRLGTAAAVALPALVALVQGLHAIGFASASTEPTLPVAPVVTVGLATRDLRPIAVDVTLRNMSRTTVTILNDVLRVYVAGTVAPGRVSMGAVVSALSDLNDAPELSHPPGWQTAWVGPAIRPASQIPSNGSVEYDFVAFAPVADTRLVRLRLYLAYAASDTLTLARSRRIAISRFVDGSQTIVYRYPVVSEGWLQSIMTGAQRWTYGLHVSPPPSYPGVSAVAPVKFAPKGLARHYRYQQWDYTFTYSFPAPHAPRWRCRVNYPVVVIHRQL
jgi:hypothetical protein